MVMVVVVVVAMDGLPDQFDALVFVVVVVFPGLGTIVLLLVDVVFLLLLLLLRLIQSEIAIRHSKVLYLPI